MANRKLENARAIVTGATSGIGRAISLELARQGVRVVATGRRAERLADLQAEVETLGVPIAAVPGDLCQPALRARLLATAESEFGGLDLLVNNAGIGAIGPFADADEARLRRIMEVNFFSLVELTRAALPMLEQGRQPLIVNVSSVLGHRGVPGKSEYCASKFAVHGFSDALRAELVSRAIDVLLVSPSTTASEFFDHARPGPDADLPAGAMSPEVVARKTVNAIRRGNHEIILSAGGKLLVWVDRLLPALADRLVARFG